jgi:hypothetical protein
MIVLVTSVSSQLSISYILLTLSINLHYIVLTYSQVCDAAHFKTHVFQCEILASQPKTVVLTTKKLHPLYYL